MRYAQARYQSAQREMAYRIYISDCIRMITESVAGFGSGPYMCKRFYDMINSKKTDARSGEEIVVDVLTRMGVSVV